jgi:hypothetical protein
MLKRNKKRLAFLACAVVAVAVAIGSRPARDVMATGFSTCKPLTIDVTDGPCTVAQFDLGSPVCKPESTCVDDCGNDYTGIEYTIGTTVDYVATLVTANNTVSPATGNVEEPTPCKGDSSTGLGKYSCHEKAVKIDYADRQKFWVVVKDNKQPLMTSVVAKKYSNTYCAAVLGFGLDSVAAPVTQILTHCTDPEVSSTCCSVEFTLDQIGGSALKAKFTQESLDNDCSSPEMKADGTILGQPIGNLELVLDGRSLGSANYGIAELNSGDTSCTTKIIGGKVYTYGKPCPKP